MSDIPQSTLTAYLETNYSVASEPPFVLRIGAASEALANLYRQHGTDCAAFVTACNPYSRKLGDAANAARQTELESDLRRRGLVFFMGAGTHPIGEWPAEPSVLVMGLPLEESKALGRKYEQNAVVWCGADTVPQLALLR